MKQNTSSLPAFVAVLKTVPGDMACDIPEEGLARLAADHIVDVVQDGKFRKLAVTASFSHKIFRLKAEEARDITHITLEKKGRLCKPCRLLLL